MLLADVGTDLFRAVLQGAPPGAVYALVALGFVLTYKTSGVFNLAFGAQAFVSAVVFFKAVDDWGWGLLPAFLLSVVVLAPALGFLLEWAIFRHLRTAPAVSTLVVCIGLTIALPSLVSLLIDFKPTPGMTPIGIVPDGDSVFYDPFGVYAFSRDELVAMSAAVLAMLALGALFKWSAIGLRMRAVVESPRMTELNGISADRVSAFAWALSSFFAGLAGVLIAPRFNSFSSGEFFNIVVVAIAAAAVGQLTSLPRALAGGLGLGVLIAVFSTFLPRWSETVTWLAPIQENVTPAIPFLVLFGVLVFDPALRRRREASDPLSGVDPPPVSQAVAAARGRGRLVLGVVATLLVVAVLYVTLAEESTVYMFLVTQAVILAIVFLSITVITGLAGQISLSQGAFAAIGGFTVYQLGELRGMGVVPAALIGGLVAAAVAAALSLPLRRLSGIWVAIATLAFAYFFDAVMVKMSWVGGASAQATRVPRPVIGPWDFEDDRAFLVLSLVVLVLTAVGVTLFSRGTTGRKLRALRGSEVASQSIGISPGRNLLVAFAVSGFVAGLGGALLSIHQENVNYASTFSPLPALFWLVLVVTFAAREPSGAIVAAVVFALFDRVVLKGDVFGWILRDPDSIPSFFPVAADWRYILFGLGTVQYARHPEGLLVQGRSWFLGLFGARAPEPTEPGDRSSEEAASTARPTGVEVTAS
jgi:branched-subunit amino acid ABC-type transport system permease component